jgi:hypothetical protein
MERETGIEPATSSLGSWHSTAELLPLSCFQVLLNDIINRVTTLLLGHAKTIQYTIESRDVDTAVCYRQPTEMIE